MKNYQRTISDDLSSFYYQNKIDFNTLFEKIYGYRYNNYTENYTAFSRFIKSQADMYFNKAIEVYKKSQDLKLKEELKDIALKDLYRRYDVLVRLEDRECFEIVLKNATDFLRGDDFLYDHGYKYESGQVLYDLALGLDYPEYRNEVLRFFKEAFDFAVAYANNDRVPDFKKGDADSTTILVLAQVISSFKKEDRELFKDLIFRIYTYSCDEDREYDTNQASGFIALLLPMFETSYDISVLDKAFKDHWPYHDNVFIHQTLYAKWILESNGNEALRYLQNEENKKWPTFAIIGLADLDYKEALPVLEKMYQEEKDTVIQEVYKEAIHRLQNQQGKPLLDQRMIQMNGNVSPTQRALGAESNNVFLQRAKEKYGIDDTVYETDED